MSFRQWSAAKRAKRNKNFYHEWKITRAFPTTHVSTYFFRKPTTFAIAISCMGFLMKENTVLSTKY
jgi:hypothetical protein